MKDSVRNKAHMKFYNRQNILDIINKKPLSRAELARKTGLTRAAVTIIVDGLVKEGIVMETTAAEADYGRKPILLDIRRENYYAIGLNISRCGCCAGITDLKGTVKVRREIALPKTNAKEALETIKKELHQLTAQCDKEKGKLLGIGITTPGPVDVFSGTILNPPNFELWNNFEIVAELKKDFPYEIYLENNSTSLALAERNFGEGCRFNSFMLLVVDTGIGAGIIINNSLYRGVGGFGGELGHTSVDMNGKPCKCGNKGCLEVYASIPVIIEEAKLNYPDVRTWKDIVDKAVSGDTGCKEIIEKEARLLSNSIVNSMNVLELEAVILTGFINYGEILVNRIREIVHSTAITRDIHKIQICMSSISSDSDIIASAAIVIEKFFNGSMLYP